MRPARAAFQPATGCPHVGVDVTGQDGVVTALELFDARGETIAMLLARASRVSRSGPPGAT
ncbi:hypothetical protein [Ralstonia pseudosolanacearum]|uniref:Uncharacterized protein n=1 Tax=Ralstonia solanacearum TaxID=305 RepID=A0AA92K588_RALSL|nr:hypothetical protein [Ralstonia pseudosolanacearum]QOK98403.1 hypothetical protein HF909_21110 [Ralstonia pseudosolanacearum]UWD88139.1 hypothetical protein NY025_05305 [Ralstonia pseudosolanacearum]CAH0442207.1 hypothetical protein LMG9673_03019 [Ralstonia pseudosolanacearum]